MIRTVPVRADGNVRHIHTGTNILRHEALRDATSDLASNTLVRSKPRPPMQRSCAALQSLGHGCLEERHHSPQKRKQLRNFAIRSGGLAQVERGKLHLLVVLPNIICHDANLHVIVARLGADTLQVAILQRLPRQEQADVLLRALLEEVLLLHCPILQQLHLLDIPQSLDSCSRRCRSVLAVQAELGHCGLVFLEDPLLSLQIVSIRVAPRLRCGSQALIFGLHRLLNVRHGRHVLINSGAA
mmetsp:Transcript_62175/g.157005  ORF Transcript_62175/g.157005 Transcript_62175/m.157005 type:complete len:242 (+) Transcript_62175:1798-2523(+)